MRNAMHCTIEYAIFHKSLQGELMELRINHEDNQNIQSVITVVVNNEIVLNKLLMDVDKIEIDAPECTIFIKEGYTDIGELIVFCSLHYLPLKVPGIVEVARCISFILTLRMS